MPELDADKGTEDKDSKEVSGVAPTLEEVHRLNQAKVEADDAGEDEKEEIDDKDESSVDKKKDAKGDDGSDDGSGDNGDDSDDGRGDDSDGGVISTEVADKDENKGKVAIKDAEGKVHYFASLDEVPDDFEPISYKALMVGVDALRDKRENDRMEADKAEKEAVKAEATKRTDALQKQWDKDEKDLVEAGLMPKGDKAEAAREKVYDYMESELKKGNVITGFKQAFKQMKYDEAEQQRIKDKEKAEELKKEQGGIVQSGSGGSGGGSGSPKSTVREAPPSGVGLDRVHADAISKL